MSEYMGWFVGLGVPLILLLVGYLAGRMIEAKHYRSLDRREQQTKAFPTANYCPVDWEADASVLVSGSAVISIDYYKGFASVIRGLFGGSLVHLNPIMERGRREAILRMKEAAIAQGYDAVMNVRLETARLASSGSDFKATTGIEMLAYGTAIRRVAR